MEKQENAANDKQVRNRKKKAKIERSLEIDDMNQAQLEATIRYKV